jgi:uncharacterized membrane protein
MCVVTPLRATLPMAAGLSLALAVAALSPMAVLAQTPTPSPTPTITAPAPTELTVVAAYPSVVVDPGDAATFELAVTAPAAERVDLSVSGLPEGWQATFQGGEATVSSVFAGAQPAPLQLRVDVDEAATPGTTTLTLLATGESRTLELPLDVVIADASGGSVELTSDFPFLRGDTSAPFSFDLDLANDTSRSISFALEASGPQGWEVSAKPAGEEQAATVLVAANDSERVTVTADPPVNAAAGAYPIAVRASGEGHTADAELGVEITGSYSLALDTPDGRLNASGTAGSVIDLPIVVANDGTAPLQAVELAGTPPRGWEVTFEPETIEVVAPGEISQAVAHITPAANAVAGDYDVTIRATTDQANDDIAIRTTVETSTLWGFVGLAIIGLVIVGLLLVFRRYGRR